MNPEIKAEWVTALRSGDYPQGRSVLNRGGSFCCLGVLCDIAVKHDVIIAHASIAHASDIVTYGPREDNLPREGYLLPPHVVAWAELPDHNPTVEFHGINQSLSNLNDNGQPFAVIADAIEASL